MRWKCPPAFRRPIFRSPPACADADTAIGTPRSGDVHTCTRHTCTRPCSCHQRSRAGVRGCGCVINEGRRKSGERAGWGHLDEGIAKRSDVAGAIVEEGHLDHPSVLSCTACVNKYTAPFSSCMAATATRESKWAERGRWPSSSSRASSSVCRPSDCACICPAACRSRARARSGLAHRRGEIDGGMCARWAGCGVFGPRHGSRVQASRINAAADGASAVVHALCAPRLGA